MAAQLAPRLPLITAARRAVSEIEKAADVTAYVAVPSHSDVLVVAATGAGAVQPWATIQAIANAAGHILLAYRDPWRRSFAGETGQAIDDARAGTMMNRGYASVMEAGGDAGACRHRPLAPDADRGDRRTRLQPRAGA
jgi:DNA-binding IclR family transcriptional regulator